MALKDGGDYLIFVGERGSEEDAYRVAYQTEHSIEESWDYDEIKTKDGKEFSPTSESIAISSTFRDSDSNTEAIKQLRKWGRTRKEVNITELDKTTLSEPEQEVAQYAGRVTNISRPRPVEGGVEVTVDYIIRDFVETSEALTEEFVNAVKDTDLEYESLQKGVDGDSN